MSALGLSGGPNQPKGGKIAPLDQGSGLDSQVHPEPTQGDARKAGHTTLLPLGGKHLMLKAGTSAHLLCARHTGLTLNAGPSPVRLLCTRHTLGSRSMQDPLLST